MVWVWPLVGELRGFPGSSDGKASATMRETWVWSLGREDPLEKEMATHSRSQAWKIPWTEEPGRLQPMGSQRGRHNWAALLHFTSLQFTRELRSTYCRVWPKKKASSLRGGKKLFQLTAHLIDNSLLKCAPFPMWGWVPHICASAILVCFWVD